jgi:hypothetical protein
MDKLIRILFMLDYNLKSCKFDAVEKRLSTIMVVTSLFGVINYSLLTDSRLGTINTVDLYNSSMHFFANLTVSGSIVDSAGGGKELAQFVEQSKEFLEKYGDDPTHIAWVSDENWMIRLGARTVERAVYAQALFIGLIMYLASIYWGLSTISTDSKYMTIWYRFVALPIYAGSIIYVVAVYILIQVYLDYVYCYLDPNAAMLAEASYLVLTKVVIAIFSITLLGVFVSNFYATGDTIFDDVNKN